MKDCKAIFYHEKHEKSEKNTDTPACHCGLDPQSQLQMRKDYTERRFRLRIKSAMTGFGIVKCQLSCADFSSLVCAAGGGMGLNTKRGYCTLR